MQTLLKMEYALQKNKINKKLDIGFSAFWDIIHICMCMYVVCMYVYIYSFKKIAILQKNKF